MEPERKQLPARASRGQRMSALLDEEKAKEMRVADDAFWNQEYFNEEEGDNEFSVEQEEEDVVDEDFDLPENDVSEPISDEEKKLDKEPKKRKNVYVDPKARKEKKKKETTDSATTPKVRNPKPQTPQPPSNQKDQRSVRESTRNTTIEKNAQREKEQYITAKRKAERMKRKPKVQLRRLTQQELLEEAKQTELYNLQSVELLQAIEDEKKRLPPPKPKIVGPTIKFLSKDGKNFVTFADDIPSYINQKDIPLPTRSTCQISNLPAKYVDPKTNIPYATVEAFRVLRETYA